MLQMVLEEFRDLTLSDVVVPAVKRHSFTIAEIDGQLPQKMPPPPPPPVCIVVPTKSDSDVILCLQLLSKTLTCTLHLSMCESNNHLCINPILLIGLIHKRSIDSKSLIAL